MLRRDRGPKQQAEGCPSPPGLGNKPVATAIKPGVNAGGPAKHRCLPEGKQPGRPGITITDCFICMSFLPELGNAYRAPFCPRTSWKGWQLLNRHNCLELTSPSMLTTCTQLTLVENYFTIHFQDYKNLNLESHPYSSCLFLLGTHIRTIQNYQCFCEVVLRY